MLKVLHCFWSWLCFWNQDITKYKIVSLTDVTYDIRQPCVRNCISAHNWPFPWATLLLMYLRQSVHNACVIGEKPRAGRANPLYNLPEVSFKFCADQHRRRSGWSDRSEECTNLSRLSRLWGISEWEKHHTDWSRACASVGVRLGPSGSKRLIYFIDDANMPLVDKYDTQSAIELIRQAVDYKGWYDKVMCHS